MTLDDLGARLFASTNEVAAIIGSDPRTVRRMIADGSIPARKNGTRHIVPVAWLRDFVGTPAATEAPSGPDLDELAERVADRLIAWLGRLLAAMAAADMTAAGPATGPAAKLDIPAKDRSHGHDSTAA
jgi:hypothetical protein